MQDRHPRILDTNDNERSRAQAIPVGKTETCLGEQQDDGKVSMSRRESEKQAVQQTQPTSICGRVNGEGRQNSSRQRTAAKGRPAH